MNTILEDLERIRELADEMNAPLPPCEMCAPGAPCWWHRPLAPSPVSFCE
jgi:hypothetical protein